MSASPCRQCAVILPADAPEGVCPACELRAVLEGDANEPPLSSLDESELELPRLFGDYELLEEIGRGGMGIVYRARQVSLDRIVAVKLLPFGGPTSPAYVKRFRAEASAAAALSHPNIITVHEVGVHQGQHYLARRRLRPTSNWIEITSLISQPRFLRLAQSPRWKTRD